MQEIDRVTKDLTVRVASVCRTLDINECDCIPWIGKLVKGIPKDRRPTVTAVMMGVKRELWGLTEAP